MAKIMTLFFFLSFCLPPDRGDITPVGCSDV
jgi:hypothetical protein